MAEPGVALFDWDNTLHHGWTLEGWVEHLLAHGILTREREPEWAARKQRYFSGEIDHNQFAEEANRDYARTLAGWSLAESAPLARQFVAEVDQHRVYPWAAPLLRWLLERGTRPVIVSGAPRELLVAHLQHLDLADVEVHGLTLTLAEDGSYAGEVASNLGTGTSKSELIQRLAATSGDVELGVGDSTSDLPILRAARRQLIVGRHARRLLEEFGASAACVPSPHAATAEDMIALVSLLTES